MQEHSYISARNFAPLSNYPVDQYDGLKKLGIDLNHNGSIGHMMHAMDNLQPLVTTGTITTPVQFLQSWLPGFVHIITSSRKIDDLVGLSTMASWEDEEIVQGVMELVGTAVPYGDYTNIPFNSWNTNFERFTVVRFEVGMQVSNLEEARASRIRVDTGSSKRESSALSLEVQRNAVGFFGYNSGLNRTYGFLNAPGLPAYVTAANGASGSPLWSTKTFQEICADIRSMIVLLRSGSKDQVDPESLDMTLALASSDYDYLSTTASYGSQTVRQWLRENYPRVRVVSAPELTAANGGANVGYLYAEKVNDLSTDDGRTFMQICPAKFMVQGVEKIIKGYQEGYLNATAGVFCKRPYAVTRITGI